MKKTVHYVPGESDYIVVGEAAGVFPIDHPTAANIHRVITTRVIRKEDDGTFETKNTIYVPHRNA